MRSECRDYWQLNRNQIGKRPTDNGQQTTDNRLATRTRFGTRFESRFETTTRTRTRTELLPYSATRLLECRASFRGPTDRWRAPIGARTRWANRKRSKQASNANKPNQRRRRRVYNNNNVQWPAIVINFLFCFPYLRFIELWRLFYHIWLRLARASISSSNQSSKLVRVGFELGSKWARSGLKLG